MLLGINSLSRMLISLCFLFCLSIEAAAQTTSKGTLQGEVHLGNGQEQPAKNLLVIAYGSYEKVNTRTNDKGQFRLTLSAGQWRVVAVADGYQQKEAVGFVTEGRTNSISPNPIVLAPNQNRSSGGITFKPWNLSKIARKQRSLLSHSSKLARNRVRSSPSKV